MANKCTVKLSLSDANALCRYLDRKHTGYTSRPFGYFMDTGKFEFVIEIEDFSDMRMYKRVNQWMNAREKYLDYCPFCGGVPLIVHQGEMACMRCADCGIETPWFYNEETAIEVWNTRFEDEGD